ncbi:hypothetical protein BV25DRAFT_1820818 [Artomyces pyxidatus]|uniref:Uncharacterized protein n=1 Tax=Artomyces pyxidatus TaxID=48021 RepID=A0ACB8TE92_9AGAM|nr:hypothetical protein BV25DRAFT_1820818 [Artomyces pyxidatus]
MKSSSTGSTESPANAHISFGASVQALDNSTINNEHPDGPPPSIQGRVSILSREGAMTTPQTHRKG